jgi:hypothetical protein
MNCQRTRWGIVIGEKYLSACEALDLLQWLSKQQDALLRVSQEAVPWYSARPRKSPQQAEWNMADEEEMRSEDEQIACFEL